MGNLLERGIKAATIGKTYDANISAVSNTFAMNKEVAEECDESLNFRIFSYKQSMPFRHGKIYKWAAAKLALTEELIKRNKVRPVQWTPCSHFESDMDYMTDDEMEAEYIDKELSALKNYRTELMELIRHLSLMKKSKSQKRKKLKRLKRLKLLSKKNKQVEMVQRQHHNNSEIFNAPDQAFSLNCHKMGKSRSS